MCARCILLRCTKVMTSVHIRAELLRECSKLPQATTCTFFIFSESVVVNMKNLQHNLSFLLGTVLNLIVLSYAKDEDLKCGGKI